jgi:hypothetical protein
MITRMMKKLKSSVEGGADVDDAAEDLGRIAIRKRRNRKIEAADHVLMMTPTKIDRGAERGGAPPIRMRNRRMRNLDAARSSRLG